MHDYKSIDEKILDQKNILAVEELTNHFLDVWTECPASFPQYHLTYTNKQKRRNESELKKFMDVIKMEVENEKNSTDDFAGFGEKYSEPIKDFLYRGFCFSEEQVEFLFTKDFLKVTAGFIKSVRAFDSKISFEEIFQACRNVWTMNWIQMLFGQNVEMTPSIFAYSMLYPYTDNFIDAPDIPLEIKIDFTDRLMRRLRGQLVRPENNTENTIYKLLEMIESQFPRHIYPDIYGSLAAIHAAQMKSLFLIDKSISMSEERLLKISIEKGGTSVLADGYLIAGDLTESQKLFLFGYGAYLQLVDDLQDVNDDYYVGLTTNFTQTATKNHLDAVCNQTYHFGNIVLSCCNSFDMEQMNSVIELMKHTNELLITEAAGLVSGLYSRKYIRQIQNYSPFRFSFLRKERKNFLQSLLS